MVKINKAVFDAGPFIHLHEIDALSLVTLVQHIFITEEIREECSRVPLFSHKQVKQVALLASNKDFAKLLMTKYHLDLGESTGIALAKQEKITLFFTDDLDARTIANHLGFSSHGTLGIILRSLREKIIDKAKAKNLIQLLYDTSSLFVTKDLISWIFKEIEKF